MKIIKCKDIHEYHTIQTILYKKTDSEYNKLGDAKVILKSQDQWFCVNCDCETCEENYHNLDI